MGRQRKCAFLDEDSYHICRLNLGFEKLVKVTEGREGRGLVGVGKLPHHQASLSFPWSSCPVGEDLLSTSRARVILRQRQTKTFT